MKQQSHFFSHIEKYPKILCDLSKSTVQHEDFPTESDWTKLSDCGL